MRRTRRAVAVILGVFSVSACGIAQPPAGMTPPRIEAVGTITAASEGDDTVNYTLADGRRFTIVTNERRLLTQSWVADLLILGSDRTGPFVAALSRQGGLPDDCYVEPSAGLDRGAYIEIHEVLWRKAAGFSPAQPIALNDAYPSLTRFCFNVMGEISGTVPP